MYESAATIVPRRRHRTPKELGLSKTLDSPPYTSTEQRSSLSRSPSCETEAEEEELNYSTPLAIRPTLTRVAPSCSTASSEDDRSPPLTNNDPDEDKTSTSSTTIADRHADGYTPLRSSIIDAGDECRPIDPILLYAEKATQHARAQYKHHLIETADSGTDLAASQACVFEWCKFVSYDPILRRRSNKRHTPIAMTQTLRLRHIRRVPHHHTSEQTSSSSSRVSAGGPAISHVVPTPIPITCNTTINPGHQAAYYSGPLVKLQGYSSTHQSVFSPSHLASTSHHHHPAQHHPGQQHHPAHGAKAPTGIVRQASTSPQLSPQRPIPQVVTTHHPSHINVATLQTTRTAQTYDSQPKAPMATTTTTSTTTMTSGNAEKMWLRKKSSSIVLPPTKIYTYHTSQLGSLSPEAIQRLAMRPKPESPPHIMTLKRFPSTVHSTPTTPPKLRSFDFSPKLSLTNPLSPLTGGSPTPSKTPSAAFVESQGGSTHFRSLTSIRRSSPRITTHFESSSPSVLSTPDEPDPTVSLTMASPIAKSPAYATKQFLSSHTPEVITEAIPESSEVTFTSAKSKATTLVSFQTPASDIIDIYAPKLDDWEQLFARALKVFDNKDNRVGHDLLVQLQDEILDCAHALKVQPHFALSSALKSGEPITLGKAGLVDEQALAAVKKRLPPITDVLEETGILFFKRYQTSTRHITGESANAAQEVEKFLKEVGMGPRGGRVEVKNPLRTLTDMPVVVYGCGPLDKKLMSNLVPCPKTGPTRWTATSRGCCPLKVCVLFAGLTEDRSQEEFDFLHRLEDLLGRMLSDWRCHKMRLFDYNALRYQAFLPVVTDVPSKDLVKLGWGEMVFNNDCVIRWKSIDGGLILAFIAGVAEAAVSKVLSLVYDGDNHAKWIPFLTETKREFALSRSEFVFSYAVSLPWPLNKRELTLHGMSTDALLISPIHAIQMWGTNVPDEATSLFGVPLPAKKNKGVTQMEMPVLSFSLTPIAKEKTYVRMVSVMDVKIGFIPMAVQNYMAKHMATKMFGNVQKICKDFDRSEYRKVMQENKEYFEELNENVAAAMTKVKH